MTEKHVTYYDGWFLPSRAEWKGRVVSTAQEILWALTERYEEQLSEEGFTQRYVRQWCPDWWWAASEPRPVLVKAEGWR